MREELLKLGSSTLGTTGKEIFDGVYKTFNDYNIIYLRLFLSPRIGHLIWLIRNWDLLNYSKIKLDMQ
jgi:hypothetical protein